MLLIALMLAMTDLSGLKNKLASQISIDHLCLCSIFLPSQKLISKKKELAPKKIKTYDEPSSSFQRVIELSEVF
jgi:hypothetical protein